MDLLTFIAELFKAIAWPIVTLVVALLFRQQIIALLARLRKGKLGSTEFEFEQEVKALREQVPELPKPPANTASPSFISLSAIPV